MEIGDKVLGFKPKDTDLNYVKEFVGRVDMLMQYKELMSV